MVGNFRRASQLSFSMPYRNSISRNYLTMRMKSNKNFLIGNEDGEIKPQFIFEYKNFLILLLTFNASVGSFFAGCTVGEFDTIQINLADIFEWNEEQKKSFSSIISSILPIGAIIGSIFSGLIINSMGRRKSFILTDIISLIGIYFKPSY